MAKVDVKKFIETLEKARGIITIACKTCNVSRQWYYIMRQKDKNFREKCDEILEMQKDFVETKLLRLIDSDDPNAIMFYMKTKCKDRGYSTTQVSEDVVKKDEQKTKAISMTQFNKLVTKEAKELTKAIENQGRNAADYTQQIKETATMIVRRNQLLVSMLEDDYSPTEIQYSREGATREIVSPREKLYLEYARQIQIALRALGLNADSREKKVEADGFGEFMKNFADA